MSSMKSINSTGENVSACNTLLSIGIELVIPFGVLIFAFAFSYMAWHMLMNFFP